MKYFRAIISLLFLNIFLVIPLLYFSHITRKLEKNNNELLEKITYFENQLNINEIEYSLYNSYEYLNKIHIIYYDNKKNLNTYNRISFNDFINKNSNNLLTVGIK